MIIHEIKKTLPEQCLFFFRYVGVTGFEPATTWSQTRCATGLRYAPIADRDIPLALQS